MIFDHDPRARKECIAYCIEAMGCYGCDNCGKRTESYDTGHCDVCGYGEEEHICEDCWEEEVCVCVISANPAAITAR